MAHPRARLIVFGRQLLISRVDAGWPAVAFTYAPRGWERPTNASEGFDGS